MAVDQSQVNSSNGGTRLLAQHVGGLRQGASPDFEASLGYKVRPSEKSSVALCLTAVLNGDRNSTCILGHSYDWHLKKFKVTI